MLVEGRADSPRLELSETSLDLGAPAVGCGAEASIALRNSGTLPLEIQSITLVDESGSYELDAPELPLSLPEASDDSRGATVRVQRPEVLTAASITAQLEVRSSDPFEPAREIPVVSAGTRNEVVDTTTMPRPMAATSAGGAQRASSSAWRTRSRSSRRRSP